MPKINVLRKRSLEISVLVFTLIKIGSLYAAYHLVHHIGYVRRGNLHYGAFRKMFMD